MLALAPSAIDEPDDRTDSRRLDWRKPAVSDEPAGSFWAAPNFGSPDISEVGAARWPGKRPYAFLDHTDCRLSDIGVQLSARAWLVLGAIARFLDWEDGTCAAGNDRLSKAARCGDRQFRSVLTELELSALIARERRCRSSGRGRRNDVIRLVGYVEWLGRIDQPAIMLPVDHAVPTGNQAAAKSSTTNRQSSTDQPAISTAPTGKQSAAIVKPSPVRSYIPSPTVGVQKLLHQLKEDLPDCEHLVETFLRPLLACLRFDAPDQRTALRDLASEIRDRPATELAAALEALKGLRTDTVTPGHIRKAIRDASVDSEAVTNLKFSYSAKKHPREYALWLARARDPQSQYRRFLSLWENHGFVLVDRPLPPPTPEEEEAAKKAEAEARFEQNMAKLRAAPFNNREQTDAA